MWSAEKKKKERRRGHLHEGKEEEGEGVHSSIQPCLWQEVEVEDECPHQVGKKGEDEEEANEALLVLLAALATLCQGRDLLEVCAYGMGWGGGVLWGAVCVKYNVGYVEQWTCMGHNL